MKHASAIFRNNFLPPFAAEVRSILAIFWHRGIRAHSGHPIAGGQTLLLHHPGIQTKGDRIQEKWRREIRPAVSLHQLAGTGCSK